VRRTGVGVIAADRRMHAACGWNARVGRAGVTVVAADRRVHAACGCTARVGRAGVTVIAADRRVYAACGRIARVGRTGVTIVTVERSARRTGPALTGLVPVAYRGVITRRAVGDGEVLHRDVLAGSTGGTVRIGLASGART